MPTTSTPPRRIRLDRNTLQALLARGGRLGPFALRVETDRHGDTVAFLERSAGSRSGR